MILLEFSQRYESQVLDLWNSSMPSDPIGLEQFRQKVLYDENFDPSLCLLALEGDRLVGFLLGMKRKFPYLERGLEPHRGWISVMFVDPDFRRQGIGRAMVLEIESRLRALGASNITLAMYSPNYFFSGVDTETYPESGPFFEAMGYQGGALSFSGHKELTGFTLSPLWQQRLESALAQGFTFGPFEGGDALEILDFAKREFGGGWKRNLLMAMRAGEAEDVVTVVKLHGEIMGFAMRKIDGSPNRFGPIGVAEKVRNAGVGGILFELKQQEMHDKGLTYLYFLSTDEPGKRFYLRHGVTFPRTFRKYTKDLT